MNKLLIVIDDQATGDYLQRTMVERGFHTAVVLGVQPMVEFCQIHSPDFTILDLDMPGNDVWGAVQYVKTIRDLANMPILGVSNDTSPMALQKAQDSGLSGMLPKQTDINTLISTVNQIMTASQPDNTTQPAAPAAASPATGGGEGSLNRLLNISAEVAEIADRLKARVGEFGDEGPELFEYITSSSGDIRDKLGTIAVSDLADKNLRHDFRNMIGSVTGFSELLLMEPDLSDDATQGFTRLREVSKDFVDILDEQKAAAA